MQYRGLSLVLVTLCLGSALGIAGCSHSYHPLALDKKTRLVRELIDDADECNIFKAELKSARINDDKVDEVFHKANIAHCIKKDV